MLFQDAILEFGFDCKVRKLSPKSITNYQKQLRYLQNYLEQEYRIKNVEQVRTAHIKMFLAMMDDKQRKPRYINDLLKAFKTFFNYLKSRIIAIVHDASVDDAFHRFRDDAQGDNKPFPWFRLIACQVLHLD